MIGLVASVLGFCIGFLSGVTFMQRRFRDRLVVVEREAAALLASTAALVAAAAREGQATDSRPRYTAH